MLKFVIKSTMARSVFGGIRALYMNYCYNYRKKMGFCDRTATVSRPIVIKNPKNVFLYENTKIVDCVIMATNARFIMKKYSNSTEGLKVITGAHERRVGRNFITITESEKKKGLDKDVVVEEDVWIGVNVTLLSGVIVGRGATVAAGSVVTKSIPPYSLNGGIPCKFIKFYWTIDEILDHEAQLYPEEERLSRVQLEEYFENYKK